MHPILIQIGDFFIGTYGLFVALGLLAGLFASDRMARRHNVDRNLILDLALLGIVAGIVGARFLYILVNFEDFLKTPMDYILTRQGFVFGGGMIFAVLASIFYIRRKKECVWKVADVIAPAIPLGHGIGRLGCFFAGCCWGGTCELPWAVRFPKVVTTGGEHIGFVYEQHLAREWIAPTATHSLPVHPVQLYESFSLFLLSAILFWAWRRRRFPGQIFLLYLLGYPVIRFTLEYFRGDAERGIYGLFSTSQYLSIAVFLGAILLWLVIKDRRIEPAPADDKPSPEPETVPPNANSRRRKRR